MIYSENPIHNVIQGEIKGGIRVCYDHQKYGSALKLIYSGIDVMAFLSMPKERKSVQKLHFVKWAEKYVRFPGNEQLSGEELYSARSELLHTHRPLYQKSPNDRRRTIIYGDKSEPPIIYNRHIDSTIVSVSVLHLMQALFRGIDEFLIEAYSVANNSDTIEERLNSLFQIVPFDKIIQSNDGKSEP